MAKTKTVSKQKKKSVRKNSRPARLVHSWLVTAGLAALLVFLLALIWAVFVSGPARVHEKEQEKVIETIEAQVPGIQGLEQNIFDYVTWQGYDTETLYWFDQTGTIITTRSLETLDYAAAREKALESYGVNAKTVELCYGYNAPVYELTSDSAVLMLDYDTLAWVYERNLDND